MVHAFLGLLKACLGCLGYLSLQDREFIPINFHLKPVSFFPLASCVSKFPMNYRERKVMIMASPWEEDILKKDYKILTSLRWGSFHAVMLAKHLPTYTQVAIKAFQKAHHTVADIRSEVTIHKSFQH